MGLKLGGKRGKAPGADGPVDEDRGGGRGEGREAAGGEEEAAPAARAGRRGRGRKAAGKAKQDSKPGAVLGFMRRGKAAREERDRAKKRQEARRRGTFRYWMRPGEEKVVTFLDGGLDKDGMLDCPSFYEHTVPHGKAFADVVCAARNEDAEGRTGRCAVCDAGGDDAEPAYIGAFTVLEWCDEPWKDNQGTEHYYRRRLFVAKPKTLDLLQTKAAKLAERQGTDGLVGVTFEVTRTGDRDARVGNMFELLSVTPPDKLAEGLVKVGDDWEELEDDTGQVLDYSQEFKLFTAEEMEDLGFAGREEPQFGRQRRRSARGGGGDGEAPAGKSRRGRRGRSIEEDM